WVLAEEEPVYRQAFGLVESEPAAALAAGEQVLGRFLQTHALVGLQDILDRYPIEEAWTRRKLQEWAESRRIVAVQPAEVPGTPQWSAPTNLEQVQRTTLALLRREIVTYSPPRFVDFVLRWQGVHPAARGEGSSRLEEVLTCLEGLPLPAELWEQ